MRFFVYRFFFSFCLVLSFKPAGAEQEDLVKKLQCKQGQACNTQKHSFGSKRKFGSKRQFPFKPRKRQDRQKIEKLADEGALPSVDQEIYFAHDSSEITPQARSKLDSIGRALTDPRLAKDRFALVGHTNTKGTEDYNQVLSERRAQAVKSYLIRKFSIKNERLYAFGRGESRLKLPDKPEAPANRRVQIINYHSEQALSQ